MANHHPEKVDRIVLNTAGGWTAHPPVMERIKALSTAAAENPTWEAIRSRLEFLMHDTSKVNDDLIAARQAIRSEERRVGKECVSTCSYRGSTEHEKKKKNNTTTQTD